MKPVEIIPVESEKPSEEDLSWEDKGEKIGDEIKVEKENDAGNFENVPGTDYLKSFFSGFTFAGCVILFPSKLMQQHVFFSHLLQEVNLV